MQKPSRGQELSQRDLHIRYPPTEVSYRGLYNIDSLLVPPVTDEEREGDDET